MGKDVNKSENLTKDEIKNNFNKQYNRYFISSSDFQAAKKYLEQFQKESNNTIKEALLIAAIISYNRPFTKNDSGDFIISNITTNLMEGLNPEQNTLHSKLIVLRNKALAHSTWGFNQLDSDTEGIVTMDEFYILHQGINIKEFLVLSDFMAYECESKSIDLKKKINN